MAPPWGELARNATERGNGNFACGESLSPCRRSASYRRSAAKRRTRPRDLWPRDGLAYLPKKREPRWGGYGNFAQSANMFTRADRERAPVGQARNMRTRPRDLRPRDGIAHLPKKREPRWGGYGNFACGESLSPCRRSASYRRSAAKRRTRPRVLWPRDGIAHLPKKREPRNGRPYGNFAQSANMFTRADRERAPVGQARKMRTRPRDLRPRDGLAYLPKKRSPVWETLREFRLWRISFALPPISKLSALCGEEANPPA